MNPQDALSILSGVVTEYERLRKINTPTVTLQKPQDLRSIVGFNVRSERLEQQMSIDKLSQLSNVGASTIRLVEQQEYNTTINVLSRLAAGLGVKASDLVRGMDE